MTNDTPPAPGSAGEDRTAAVLCYITIIGFVVAIILHSNRKTQLGSFHLRQALGLLLSGFAFGIAAIVLTFIPFIGWLAVMVGWISLLVLVIIGLLGAINGQQKPVPVLGEKYQQWFANTFT
jgi:uncharacterized membrane protein